MSDVSNRRDWLKTVGTSLSVSALGSMLPQQLSAFQEKQDSLGKSLNFLTKDPRNGEPQLQKLIAKETTPVELFYVRSHAANPKLDASSFKFTVEGLVRKPLTLTLDDLKRIKQLEQMATLTCAGNRRAEFNTEAKVGGVQWGSGAIGNAKWNGASLAEILKLAQPLENAKHIWFEGHDQIEKKKGTVIPFGASIPIERAMKTKGNATVLLATQMNGKPLTPDHGFPLRTVVPGYIGARSVKWLGKIIVGDRPSTNHYVAKAYKIVKKTEAIDWAEAGPIYRYPINGAICSVRPSADSKKIQIVSGYALASGRAGCKITKVEISSDEGRNWTKAKISQPSSDFCWALWVAEIAVKPETKTLIMRAFDSSGNFMPKRVPWNAKGYLQNSWFRKTL